MSRIVSAAIYLGVFISSLFFTYVAEYNFKKASSTGERFHIKKTFIWGLFFSILALFIPCWLAGVRADTVGIDINVYVRPNYNRLSSVSVNLSNFREYISGVEFLFSLLIFVFAKIQKYSWLLFTIEALIIVPVYISAYKLRHRHSMCLTMLIYFMLYYNISLCIMRQFIAMGFLLLAYLYYNECKYIPMIVLSTVAVLFHISSILFLLAFTILIGFRLYKKKYFTLVLTIGLLSFFWFYFDLAYLLMRLVSLVSMRYRSYISRYLIVYGTRTWGNVPATDLVVKTFLLVLVVVMVWYCKKGQCEEFYQLVLLVALGRYFVLFEANFFESLRVAYLFDYFSLLLLPYLAKCFKRDILNQITAHVMIGMIVFSYWAYFIIYIGAYRTAIYSFAK